MSQAIIQIVELRQMVMGDSSPLGVKSCESAWKNVMMMMMMATVHFSSQNAASKQESL